MRVLYIANRAEILSGGQISLLEFLAGIDKSRFDPVVLCPGKGSLAEGLSALGIPVRSWDMPTVKTFNMSRIPKKIRELRSIIKETEASIVHTNGSRAQFYSSFAVRGTGCGLVWNVRESLRDIPYYDRLLAGPCDRIICVSRAVRDRRFGRFASSDPKIQVIYNGVDTRKFAKDPEAGRRVRDELGIGKDKVLLGTIGMIIPRKGHEFLFRSLKQALKTNPDLVLLVAGKTLEGPYTCRFKEMIYELKLENNVMFTDSREDIKDILSALDVFILSSKSEGFSRVLLEAMACSLPIIATDVEGNNEAIEDGVSGRLVPYGDIDSMVLAIEGFMVNRQNAENLGKNAKKRAGEFFSIDSHVSQVQDLYGEIVKSRKPGV